MYIIIRYSLSLKCSILCINNRLLYTIMINSYLDTSYQVLEFYVKVCYNLQPVDCNTRLHEILSPICICMCIYIYIYIYMSLRQKK